MRVLLERRWLLALAGALAVAAVCVVAGRWQYAKHVSRDAAADRVSANYGSDPRALEDAVPALLDGAPLDPAREWTPVVVTGRYAPEATLLVRGRVLEGSPGYEVLVPLVLDDGRALLVDRGWLPTGQTGSGPAGVPRPPDGAVEAVVRLRPGEAPLDRDAPAGQLWRVDLDAAADAGGLDLLGAYGVLAAEDPAPAAAPVPLPRPSLDVGPHLPYAVQWWLLAGAVLVGFGVSARREAQARAAGTAPPAQEPAPVRRPRRGSDEEAEDALLDAGSSDRM